MGQCTSVASAFVYVGNRGRYLESMYGCVGTEADIKCLPLSILQLISSACSFVCLLWEGVRGQLSRVSSLLPCES